MILSNFILFFTFRHGFDKSSQSFQSKLNHEFNDLNSSLKFENRKSHKYLKIFTSNSIVSKNSDFLQSGQSNSNRNNLVSRNFWQKFVNNYLQETIFLSPSSSVSNKYVNKLKSLGLSVYQGSEYRAFLHRFSKDLVSGKIKVGVSNVNDSLVSLYTEKQDTYLVYKWLKFLNFESLLLKDYKKKISTKLNEYNVNLINDSLPMFIIINSNNEMIISESTDQLSKNEIILKLYRQLIKKDFISKKLYTGLIFINNQDALEYKQSIEYQFANSTRSIKLKVVPTNMKLYSKFTSQRDSNLEFRLIPDLKEVSNLLHKYRSVKNITFEPNQQHGRNHFQGQPIYCIKPFYVKNKNTNSIEKVNYSYRVKGKTSVSNYKAIFFNYQTLMDAWKKFAQENASYSIPNIPDVSVSNLEAFIQSSNYKQNYDTTIFLPSMETYDFIKKFLITTSGNQINLRNRIINQSLFLKTLCYRIFWSLTTRQPIHL
uniref:Uncharacterized protein n=1 Tax=Polysiphonia urceolata TaxID=173545 RepID=A0A1Z1MBY5_POLUR|nr:hypothetical protein [Polysiphonia stricta]ARW63490.1 hypothetical protein [Polysiphonia stricta]